MFVSLTFSLMDISQPSFFSDGVHWHHYKGILKYCTICNIKCLINQFFFFIILGKMSQRGYSDNIFRLYWKCSLLCTLQTPIIIIYLLIISHPKWWVAYSVQCGGTWMYTDAFGLNAWPDFYGSAYIRAADSLHVAQDVTTNTDTQTHECMYAHVNIVTQAMSAGPVVCDVIRLSC